MASARAGIKGLHLTLPAVLMNGVMLTDISTGSAVAVQRFTKESADLAYRTFIRHGRPPFVYFYKNGGVEVEYTALKNEYESSFLEARRKNYRHCRNVREFTEADDIIYINAIDTENVILPIYEQLREIPGVGAVAYPDNYDSRYFFLESFSGSAGKWNGIKFLKEQYGFERVVAFGDNLNDLEMLRNADFSIVTGNGHEKAKAAADLVIATNDEDAVARYLLENVMMAD